MRYRHALLGWLVACLATAAAGTTRADAVDDLARTEMARQQIPGLAVLVQRDGHVVKAGYYGKADIASGAAVDARTVFPIGSMAKAFTAAGVLLLVQDGKLRLDDPVGKYLDGVPATWNRVTIRGLLNHTAGVDHDWDHDTAWFEAHPTNAAMLAELERAPLHFQPGDGYYYGAGPFVAGLVIEKVSGLSYAEFMRRRVFEPLGMTSTWVCNDPTARRRATGYDVKDDGKLGFGAAVPSDVWGRGDAGIESTAPDMARWDRALSKPGLLTAESLTEMFTPAGLTDGSVTHYGLGWNIMPYRGHLQIEHDGAFRTGYGSTIARYEGGRLTVVVLSNLNGGGGPWMTWRLGRAIAARYNGDFQPLDQIQAGVDAHPLETTQAVNLFGRMARGEITNRTLSRRYHAVYDSRVEHLAGLKRVEPLGGRAVADPASAVYGKPVAWVGYYRVRAKVDSYWSIDFARDGEILHLEHEL